MAKLRYSLSVQDLETAEIFAMKYAEPRGGAILIDRDNPVYIRIYMHLEGI
jgi:ribosomal protein L16/L10AE